MRIRASAVPTLAVSFAHSWGVASLAFSCGHEPPGARRHHRPKLARLCL